MLVVMPKLLKIAQLGNPALRGKAVPVPVEALQNKEVQQLIDDMFATLEDSNRPGWSSVGLAAPQVHVPKRLFILRFELEDESGEVVQQVFINPQVLNASSEQAEDFESCLSLPDMLGLVKRSERIKVKALNREGEEIQLEARDFYARVILHEIDHLDGTLFGGRRVDLKSLTFIENLPQQYQLRQV